MSLSTAALSHIESLQPPDDPMTAALLRHMVKGTPVYGNCVCHHRVVWQDSCSVMTYTGYFKKNVTLPHA